MGMIKKDDEIELSEQEDEEDE
jgi:glutaredoxin 2